VRLTEARLLTRHAVRRAQTQLIQPAAAEHRDLTEEVLFRCDPRRTQRWILREREILTERAVLVRADGARQEQAIAPRDLLAHVAADRDDRLVAFVDGKARARGGERSRTRHEVAARAGREVLLLVEVLATDDRRRLQRAREVAVRGHAA